MRGEDVAKGMANTLWKASAPRGASTTLAATPDAAMEAAYALLDLYAEANGCATRTQFLEKYEPFLRRHLPRASVSDREIGFHLAVGALRGLPWMSEGMAVPVFEVRYERGEIVWEGEAGKDVGVQMARQNPPWKPIGVSGGGRYITYYPDGRKSWAFEDGTLARDWAKEIGGTVEDRGPAGYTHYARPNPPLDGLPAPKDWPRGGYGVQPNPPLPKPPTVDRIARAFGYIEREFTLKDGIIDGEMWAEGLAFHGPDRPDEFHLEQARAARSQLTDDQWVDIAARAQYLRMEQGLSPNPVGDHVDVVRGPGRGRSGVVESETEHVARVRFDRGGSGHLERSALRTRGRSRG
jgi:hypothetical protein